MSKQTLDTTPLADNRFGYFDQTVIDGYFNDNAKKDLENMIRQEQLSLLKRLLEKSVHLHANFSPEVIEAVPSEAIESEILELEAQK